MLKISINGEVLDLPKSLALDIEDTNPVYNDRGSQSLPATVPVTPRNLRVLGFPSRPDSDMVAEGQKAVVTDGAYIRTGAVNIVSAGRRDGITFNVGFDNSTAYQSWIKKKLPDISGMPVITSEGETPIEPSVREVDIYDVVMRIYWGEGLWADRFAAFPVIVDKKECENGNCPDGFMHEILNVLPHDSKKGSVRRKRNIWRLIGDELKTVTVPAFYGLTVFPKVGWLLEMIFADGGYTVTENPFRDDPELARLVVLNSCVDIACKGYIDTVNTLPDVTVEDFLKSLWVRFGLVYSMNDDTGEVSLRLIKDIIREAPQINLSKLKTDWPLVNFEAAQYVKLSAATSIEGAAPLTERWEDFSKGLTLKNMLFGNKLGDIQFDEDRSDFDFGWDDYDQDRDWGEEYDEELWDFEDFYDENWDGRDDDRYDDRDEWGNGWDDDLYDGREMSRSRSMQARVSDDLANKDSAAGVSQELPRVRLGYEVETGRWYKLDYENKATTDSSSSFFCWDPQPEGLEAMELASDDECVPVIHAQAPFTNGFTGNAPGFLIGAKYVNTMLVNNGQNEEDEAVETPLAFAFAYVDSDQLNNQGTVGRISPEMDNGKLDTCRGTITPRVSLYFQFKNGLFNRFWRSFDELLRHANRKVEIPAALDRLSLIALDSSRPVMLDMIPYLIDTASYSLPSGDRVKVDFTLRPLVASGDYDIVKEQGVPDFEPGLRKLKWCYSSDNMRNEAGQLEVRQRAVEELLKKKPQCEPGGFTAELMRLVDARPTRPTWIDFSNNNPAGALGSTITRTFKGRALFAAYPSNNAYIEALKGKPFDTVIVEFDYLVSMESRWVQA